MLALRERFQKICLTKNPLRWPKPRELVLIHSDSPRALWPIATILKVHFNESNFPDTALVKTSHNGNTLLRSISHLYPLETVEEIENRISHTQPIITQITKENKTNLTSDQGIFSSVVLR